MKVLVRSRLVLIPSVMLVVAALLAIPLGYNALHPSGAKAASPHMSLDCTSFRVCTDVADSDDVFGGDYVGHDEPSLLFYSDVAGSGSRQQYRLTLPKDPPVRPTQADANVSANFQLHPAFWLGVAMCDTQSYPEQISTCAPGSDSNIVDITKSPNHPGTAFTELQFYPPGWVGWPNNPGACDPTKWCAALNIDSLSFNPLTRQSINPTCRSITGQEYVNFAFITRNGRTQAPANPVESTLTTFTPDPTRDLFMNSGDQLSVTLRDSTHGLHIEIKDLTTGQTGSMTASAENSFGQVKFAPAPSTECTNIPYDFHPMYSTSSEKTDVPWATHSYNVAFSDEIGHWEYCSLVPQDGGGCAANATEGAGSNQEPSDADESLCFSQAPSGCSDFAGAGNTGFDGPSYQPVWPDGDTAHHPTSILFSTPLTGDGFTTSFSRMGFETDLPALEPPSQCNIVTGAGCSLIPQTDDGVPAAFYPFFTLGRVGEHCVWTIGSDIPGITQNDFGRNSQYGPLLVRNFLRAGGVTQPLFVDFQQILPLASCK
ncbi:MAG TPA: hypothetical protein VH540_11225 [Ktedonobacterales bacterium]|jgi:hypothetical protein